jgi:hypothetical protein
VIESLAEACGAPTKRTERGMQGADRTSITGPHASRSAHLSCFADWRIDRARFDSGRIPWRTVPLLNSILRTTEEALVFQAPIVSGNYE